MALVMKYTDPGIEVIMSFHNKKQLNSQNLTPPMTTFCKTYFLQYLSRRLNQRYSHLRDRNLSAKKNAQNVVVKLSQVMSLKQMVLLEERVF